MADFFNAVAKDVNDSPVVVFTSNSDSTIILSILAANKNGTSTVDATVAVNTDATLDNYIGYTIPVPADSNVDFISNKYILPSGKNINVECSASGDIDVSISYVVV